MRRHKSRFEISTLMMNNDEGFAYEAPVTIERKLPTDIDQRIENPGLPRANYIISKENPNPLNTNNPKSVLQQHVDFFDRNHDGIIHPWETWTGFRAVGFGWILSFLGAMMIHLTMSFPTWDYWLPPDPFMPIVVRNIHKCKHGSDSEVYDTEGRFVPEKFEEIFSKYAQSSPDSLTWEEMFEMTAGNSNVNDFFGWSAAKLEWLFLWILSAENGRLSKHAVLRQFDGSLFRVYEDFLKGRFKEE